MGLGLGVAFGAALQRSLVKDGITEFAVPWPLLAVVLGRMTIVEWRANHEYVETRCTILDERVVQIETNGTDETDAMAALQKLIADKFGEGK